MNNISELVELKYEYATSSRLRKRDAKLMVIQNQNLLSDSTIIHSNMNDIADFFEKGDILVINNSGVLPASFPALHETTKMPVEIRLMASLSDVPKDATIWKAYILGEGDWRTKTEDRKKPPTLNVGDILIIADDLTAEIISVDENSGQMVELRFISYGTLWQQLFKYGHPIQYSYLTHDLDIWDQQTIFSTIPISVEAPSASFQFRWDQIFKLRQKGVLIIPITHAINLSNTGEKEIDVQLPFPERYWITEESAQELNLAIREHRRIIAIGTSVIRALESNFEINNGLLASGSFITDLKISPNFKRKIVSGLLTGMHMPDESHIEILRNFLTDEEIVESYEEAMNIGYLWHEYGDLTLILK